jgi:3-oxoacyl-[acyl-carrier protein] reductase
MFADKSVIVTGAGRGMGRSLATAFAARGAAVCLGDLDGEAAEAAAAAIRAEGGKAVAVEADIRQDAPVGRMVAAAVEAFGRLDILVNAAGGYGEGFRKSHETPEAEWDMVVDSNLKGSFLCAKHAIPEMIKAGGGRIINFSSNAGRTVSPLLGCSYTAAKAGVIGLTRHLSREYAAQGILVNTIAPGPVRGDRLADLLDGEGMKTLADQIPLGRLAEPDDIVGVVIFMASPESRFMTGAILDVNGGYVLA